MHKSTRMMLNFIQKVGFDEFMIRMTGVPFINRYISKYAWQHESYEHCRARSEYLRDLISKYGDDIDLKNKNILEIGSGNSIGIGYFFFNDGYNSWTASDYSRNPNESSKTSKLEYESAKNAAKNIDKQILKSVQFENNKVVFHNKFKFIKMDITQLNSTLVDTFDFIISNSVMEHIPREGIDVAMANMIKYLKKGGIMFHGIDFKDHVNPLNPFGYYKFSTEKWGKLTKNSIFYTNRLRLSDFVALCEKHSIPHSQHILETSSLENNHIDQCFLDKYTSNELKICEAVLVARKGQ